MELKIVIDTNVLVSALSSKSNYHWLIDLLLEEKFDLYITDEILFEYEEILKAKYSESVPTNLSHDSHFSILKQNTFPKVNVIKLDEFQSTVKDLL